MNLALAQADMLLKKNTTMQTISAVLVSSFVVFIALKFFKLKRDSKLVWVVFLSSFAVAHIVFNFLETFVTRVPQ
jgi:hypothetical protein